MQKHFYLEMRAMYILRISAFGLIKRMYEVALSKNKVDREKRIFLNPNS